MSWISRLINARVHGFVLILSGDRSIRILSENNDFERNLFWKSDVAFIVVKLGQHNEKITNSEVVFRVDTVHIRFSIK